MTKIFIFFSTLFISLSISAQDVGIGAWKEHLSYKNGLSVTEGNGKIFCATTSGIFSLNRNDNSMDRMSKVNGLSDVEGTVINYNKYNNKLLIAYKNSNIDIVEDNGSITNISDIKRKSIIGNKSINNIYFVNQFAYLSCGFGIVVIDMDRLEVKDTYYIGANGAAINVNSITSDGNKFYVATSSGIYSALMSNPNLANFISWQKITTVPNPNGDFNAITVFSGKIFVNLNKVQAGVFSSFYKDTLYVYNGVSWNYFNQGISATTYSLSEKNHLLVVVQRGAVLVYDASLNNTGYYGGYFGTWADPNSAVIDITNTTWIADARFGLVSYNSNQGFTSNFPNGPASPRVFNMAISDGNLWVAPGSKSRSYFYDGLYYYSNSEWKNPHGDYPGVVNLDTVLDFVNVIVDPNDPLRAYASSWNNGLVELYNGVPVKLYNAANTAGGLKKNTSSGGPVWVDGLAFDANNNLWIANSGQTSSLAVKHPNGTWQSINLGPIMGTVSAVQILGKMIIDKNDQKWVIFTQGGDGLMVYRGGTTATSNSSNTKKLSNAPGNGALPSPIVFSMAEDMDGEIWVGTDKGICVFYNPENVFSGSNFDSQQILLEQDGHVQILLETETVQAIAVDDANRKWMGTSKSGVFLMSADGTKQIYHFDTDNSPLLSNNVKSIVIDHATGEVYFGTDKGIIVFRGTATEGFENYTDVYSFPNPVKSDYTGPIAIKGLVANSIVKITDISGVLVYETKSEGGQAIWNGKNFAGEKVSTGVYMVFCASEDGTQKIATKILFIN